MSEHGSQWAAISSVATKIGCTAETLRRWVRQSEINAGQRAGVTTSEAQRVKELEREVQTSFSMRLNRRSTIGGQAAG